MTGLLQVRAELFAGGPVVRVVGLRRVVPTDRAQRAHRCLERAPHAAAPGLLELVAEQNRLQHALDLVRRADEGCEILRDRSDQRGRWRITDQAPTQLGRDMLRRTRMCNQPIEHIATVLHRRLIVGRNIETVENLVAAIMPVGSIDKRTVVVVRVLPITILDRPAGQRRGGFIDIVVDIACRKTTGADDFGFENRRIQAWHRKWIGRPEIVFDAERMQLDHLACDSSR